MSASMCSNIEKLLVTLIHDAIAHNFTSFYRDIVSRNLSSKISGLYRWDGYYADILDFEDYFKTSMDLIRMKRTAKRSSVSAIARSYK